MAEELWSLKEVQSKNDALEAQLQDINAHVLTLTLTLIGGSTRRYQRACWDSEWGSRDKDTATQGVYNREASTHTKENTEEKVYTRPEALHMYVDLLIGKFGNYTYIHIDM